MHGDNNYQLHCNCHVQAALLITSHVAKINRSRSSYRVIFHSSDSYEESASQFLYYFLTTVVLLD